MASTMGHHRGQGTSSGDAWARALSSTATPISVIWATVVATALLAPDMITGSDHEHLPLTGLTIWIWAAAASSFVALGANRVEDRRRLVTWTSVVWVVVLLTVLLMPSLVTGTDPTTIPLAGLVAPPAGALATGYVALSGCPTIGSG